MKNSILKYLIISLVVVLTVVFFAYQKAETPTQKEITINDEIVEFEQFNSEELGISLLTPKESEVIHEQGRVKVIYTKQENLATEVTDGFIIFINNEKIDEDLNQFVQSKFQEKTENLESVSEPEEVSENKYTFQVKNSLGGTQTYEIISLNENAITASYFIANPNNYDYQTVVDEILKTVEIN